MRLCIRPEARTSIPCVSWLIASPMMLACFPMFWVFHRREVDVGDVDVIRVRYRLTCRVLRVLQECSVQWYAIGFVQLFQCSTHLKIFRESNVKRQICDTEMTVTVRSSSVFCSDRKVSDHHVVVRNTEYVYP